MFNKFFRKFQTFFYCPILDPLLFESLATALRKVTVATRALGKTYIQRLERSSLERLSASLTLNDTFSLILALAKAGDTEQKSHSADCHTAEMPQRRNATFQKATAQKSHITVMKNVTICGIYICISIEVNMYLKLTAQADRGVKNS